MKKVAKNQSDFVEKVSQGLKISFEKLVQTKIQNNQSLVIMHNGKVVTVKASELKNL